MKGAGECDGLAVRQVPDLVAAHQVVEVIMSLVGKAQQIGSLFIWRI